MDFTLNGQLQAWRDQVVGFMHQHIYPAVSTYELKSRVSAPFVGVSCRSLKSSSKGPARKGFGIYSSLRPIMKATSSKARDSQTSSTRCAPRK